ncbi:hypothetical protein L596_005917 [Steinernema carpocapsae]|uniref:Uncharacterized protein n=1 Tax=Steinernema carpocapsae TaxID=34508 RepID=A0A4U8V0S7_STECR|nr:hypothetical protein L596_005917 [Steinernema carpocapsae]
MTPFTHGPVYSCSHSSGISFGPFQASFILRSTCITQDHENTLIGVACRSLQDRSSCFRSDLYLALCGGQHADSKSSRVSQTLSLTVTFRSFRRNRNDQNRSDTHWKLPKCLLLLLTR